MKKIEVDFKLLVSDGSMTSFITEVYMKNLMIILKSVLQRKHKLRQIQKLIYIKIKL